MSWLEAIQVMICVLFLMHLIDGEPHCETKLCRVCRINGAARERARRDVVRRKVA